jgi:hypothetical protein
MFCFGASKIFAGPAAEERIDIDAVVNVVVGVDAGYIDDATTKGVVSYYLLQTDNKSQRLLIGLMVAAGIGSLVEMQCSQ